MLRNPIAQNSFFLAAAGAARGIAEVLVVILAVRALGASEGGQVILGFTVIRIAAYVAEGGLGMYLTREIPRRPADTGTYTLEAIKLVALLSIPAGVVLATGTAFVDLAMAASVLLATAAVMFGACQPILGGAFLAHDQAHWQFRNTLAMAVTLVAGGALGAAVAPSLLVFFLAIAVSRAIGFGVGMFDFVTRLKPVMDWSRVSSLRALKRGFPYGLQAVGSYLYLRVDIVLLGVISGAGMTGIYGAVADPLVSLTALIYIITRAFLPSLSRCFKDQPERFDRLTRRMLLLSLALGSLTGVVVFLGAGPFVSIAFSSEFAPAADLLRILSLSVALRFLNSGLATVLTAAGQQWRRTVAVGAAAVFNILLNLLTMPFWGYWAAAWTTVGTEVLLLLLLLGLLRSHALEGSRWMPRLLAPVAARQGSDVP